MLLHLKPVTKRQWSLFDRQYRALFNISPTADARLQAFAVDWLKDRLILPPILSTKIINDGGNNLIHDVITLSDTGSNIAFIDSSFCAHHNINPLGTWKGHIDTLLSSHAITTPFFPVDFRLTNGQVRRVIALGCENIGTATGLAPHQMLQLSTIFKVNSKDVENCTGLIRVLLGQESQKIAFREGNPC